MNAIERLWTNYELPTLDALYFADGRSYEVEQDSDAPSGLKLVEPFDLDEFLVEEPEWVTRVDGQRSVSLADGGFLWGGDGAHGSNGFCARLNADRTLVWAMFFQVSNPFTEVQVADDVAVFHSTSGVSITVDIDDPLSSVAM